MIPWEIIQGKKKSKERPWGNLDVPGMGAEEDSLDSSWRGQKGRKWTGSWAGWVRHVTAWQLAPGRATSEVQELTFRLGSVPKP